MAKAFKLPDLGEGIHEGEILSIRVSVGDEVKEGDIIMEVETDKAAVEIPSPYTGMVEEILVKPGDTVKVGDVLVTFRTAEAEAPAPRAEEREVVRPEKEVAPPKLKRRSLEGRSLEGRQHLLRLPGKKALCLLHPLPDVWPVN